MSTTGGNGGQADVDGVVGCGEGLAVPVGGDLNSGGGRGGGRAGLGHLGDCGATLPSLDDEGPVGQLTPLGGGGALQGGGAPAADASVAGGLPKWSSAKMAFLMCSLSPALMRSFACSCCSNDHPAASWTPNVAILASLAPVAVASRSSIAARHCPSTSGSAPESTASPLGVPCDASAGGTSAWVSMLLASPR